MKLFTTVIHAPWASDRLPFVKRTLKLLGPDAVVLRDKTRSGIVRMTQRAYMEALRVEGRYTHHLIVQDDVYLCDSFASAALNALAACPPSTVLSFWHNWSVLRPDVQWVSAYSDFGGLCIATPIYLCGPLFSWLGACFESAVKNPSAFPNRFGTKIGEDVLRDIWLWRNGISIRATNPCLVAHGDPSVPVGGRHSSLLFSENYNKHRFRWESFFVDGGAARSIEWGPSTKKNTRYSKPSRWLNRLWDRMPLELQRKVKYLHG